MDKRDERLARSLVAGLKQESERPDADDERFNKQAAALRDSDCFDTSGPIEPVQNEPEKR